MIKNYLSPRLFFVFLTALFIAQMTPANAQVSEMTLDNGLRIIVAESHQVPIVAVDVWVKAGTRREKPGQEGVAHFLEHVLFKGTPTHPDEESVDGAIEDLGGTLDAATSYDWAHFYTEVPSSGYPQAVALLADILQHASIKSDAVDEERSIIIDEIGRESDDPIASLTDTVRGIFYDSSSAYGRPITGSVDDVRSVTRDEVAQFYSTYYVPNNVTVVVSGDVTPTEVDSLVDEQFHNWKRSISLPDEGSAFASHYASVPTDASRIHKYLTQRDANQSYVVMAFSAPSVSDTPDAWTMDVLLTLLGQGPNNRLDTSLRQKLHLVDSISADYLTQRDPGVFTIAVSLPTSNVDVVQADILDQVRKVREAPVSDSELQRAKNALKSSYLFDVDTDSGHADSLGFYDSIDTYQYDVQYLDHVSSVTAEALMQVAQKYLDPDAYTVALQVPTPDVSTAYNAQSNPRLTMTTAWSDQK